jgi:hypothetical protein
MVKTMKSATTKKKQVKEKETTAAQDFCPDMPYRLSDDMGVLADKEERDATYHYLISRITDPQALEALASYLCNLRMALWDDREIPSGSDRVSSEIGYFLEYLFKHSKAYAHAFTMYSGRFQLLATSPEVLLEEVLKIHGKGLQFRDLPEVSE